MLATRRIRSNRPRAAAMRPRVKLLWPFVDVLLPRAGSGAVSKWVICACDSLVDFGTVWMWLICIFVFAYLSYLYFSFFLFYAFYLLFYFFFYLLPSRILDPLRFQAGGRWRRPNLGLVCFDLMFAVFLVKDASVCYVVVDLVLVLWCDSCLPCCRR